MHPNWYRLQAASFAKLSTSYSCQTLIFTGALLRTGPNLRNFHKCLISYSLHSVSFHKFSNPYSCQTFIFADALFRIDFTFQIVTTALIRIDSNW